jgi:dihydroorotase
MTGNYSRFDVPARAANLLLKGARVIDPAIKLDQIVNLHVKDGVLHVISGESVPSGADVIDLRGHWITPGWFDLHVHLREPGKEVAETIATGCMAAMNGGFTGIACMPNTQPPLDDAASVNWVRDQARGFPVEVNVIAAVTRGREGKELVDMSEIVEAGVRAFSDDGGPVKSSAVLRHAVEYSNMLGARIFEHAEDKYLADGGCMNESEWSTRLGVAGIPTIAEAIDVARCVLISEYTGGAIHICHVSARESVEQIRSAKERGLKVTAEVCPHHLLLTDEMCKTFDTNYKMNPPLRGEEDRKACWEAFLDGTLDVYCTDHAPHSWEDKTQEFDVAPFGIVGLETALGLALTHFLNKGMTLETLLDRVVYAPRRILAQDVPSIAEGKPANLTIVDPEHVWKVDPGTFKSLSHNTPFGGWEMKGRARGVINRGYALIQTF